ncbi:LacI family DNA-binding transcriptional regulator [Maridesulfovibrio sp.]|uniref:LacI family DNA-binding transcriptional regulator n=1 Tax=Maridesulfovibrio sp. TaxID=2795000 RepID=UPI0029F4A5B3|nr:LacI family DNA-binding transcriptional regulator [Maridesulfovibrio sp.]
MSTILDVARLAQVSTATVSRVINSPETVREPTRKKVLRAMKMCNYKYNALARGFVTKKSNTIGLIIPNINNPVFAESTLGVQEYANSKNIKVILGNTSYDAEQEKSVIKALRESQVDGLIITSTDPKGKLIKSLTEENVPIVLLFSTVKPGPISAVGVDNFRGGYEATEHLISLGHRRIGMVSGNFAISDRAHHRWHGYRQCLKDHNIIYDSQLLVQTVYSLEGGEIQLGSCCGWTSLPAQSSAPMTILPLVPSKGRCRRD